MGNSSTRLALIFYLTNRAYNEIIIRCFSNGIEAILSIIAFHYYLQVKNKFNKSVAIMTALISISFIMRNTSPIGWIPLLFIKVVKEGSFKAFFIALILVGLPLIGLSILLDTMYYGNDEWTITSLNFLRINLVEGLSKYFGDDPSYQYLFVYMPMIFTVLYPASLLSFYVYAKDTISIKKTTPILTYFVGFYLIVFSIISHKEYRFLVPIIPFTFLMIGYLLFRKIQHYPKLITLVIILSVVIESAIIAVMSTFHFRGWETMRDL